MGVLTLYAIKSSIVLALLYLPYTLLLRKETFHAFNRVMLLTIIITSLVTPCVDVSDLLPSSPVQEAISNVVTLPTLIVEVSLSSPKVESTSYQGETGWGVWLVLIYIIGMLLLLLWKVTGMIRLMRFIPRGCLWTDNMKEATVYCHAGNVSPFSWMRSIVIGERDAKDIVLAHELAHIRMHHSWDTLFVSLVEVLQWFNPCIWMLDASLREVHEYEADDAVLRRGISARDYQLLLIEKAVARTPYPMVNAFRHSLLKNRITMMTKKKSSSWARLKVLYAVPLTLVALAAFASQQMEEKMDPLTFINNKRVTKEEVKQLDQTKIAHIEVFKPETVSMKHDGSTEVLVTTSEPEDQVYDKPEVLPEFSGGQGEMWSWISKNIKYPQQALQYGVEGRVYIQFVVEKDGSISNIKPIAGPGGRAVVVTAYKAKNDTPEEQKKEGEDKGREALQEEAIRVVKAMPNWIPGRDKGKTVRTKFVMPVMFRLS